MNIVRSLVEGYIARGKHRGKRYVVRAILRVTRFKFLKSYYGPILWCDARDNTNVYGISGEYGDAITNHIDTALRDGDIFIDIGANCGLFSLYAAIKKPFATIISFEPNPRIYQRLLQNIEVNEVDNILTFHAAIGPDDEIVHLSYAREHSGKSSISARKGDRTLTTPQFNISKWSILESLVKDRGIHIKIDVEGYEYKILKTLQQAPWFSQVRSIVVEIDHKNLAQFNDTSDQIYREMSANGFKASSPAKGEHYDEIFLRHE